MSSAFDRGQFLHRVFLAFEELRVISSVLFELSNPSHERVLMAVRRSESVSGAVQLRNAIGGGSCCRRIIDEADRLEASLMTTHQLMMDVVIPVKCIGGWRIQWSPSSVSASLGCQWVVVIGSLKVGLGSDGALADEHVQYTRLLVNGLVVDCSEKVGIDVGECTSKVVDGQLIRLLHSHLAMSIFKFWTTNSAARMLQSFASNKAIVIDGESEFHIELVDDLDAAYSCHPKAIDIIHDALVDDLRSPFFYSF